MKSSQDIYSSSNDFGAPIKKEDDGGMLAHIRISIVATLVLAVVVCAVYPLVVWGLSQLLFHDKANGSLITNKDGKVIGSRLLGQSFPDANGIYFHPRPSAAGNGYDATASGGSNLGPMSKKLLYGTTKDSIVTVIATDKAHEAAGLTGRAEGAFVSSTDKSITISTGTDAAAKKTTYPLDKDVTITAEGRTLKKTTPAAGANAELKLNTATPPAVTAVTVIDKVSQGTVKAVDADAGKVTLAAEKEGDADTDYVVPSTAWVIVNGKLDAKAGEIPVGAKVQIMTATVMDFDGIADRTVQYCETNGINYTSSVPPASFKDADGVDDFKLISAFNGATNPMIKPSTPVPADAVTMSGSGLDPHISVENARIQAKRVADARKMTIDAVNKLIAENTDGSDLGILGDAGVNVVMLNLALDQANPPTPATAPTASASSNTPVSNP